MADIAGITHRRALRAAAVAALLATAWLGIGGARAQVPQPPGEPPQPAPRVLEQRPDPPPPLQATNPPETTVVKPVAGPEPLTPLPPRNIGFRFKIAPDA